jgi:hypothetical protein
MPKRSPQPDDLVNLMSLRPDLRDYAYEAHHPKPLTRAHVEVFESILKR